MKTYIESYLSILPKSQKERFTKLIDVGSKPVGSGEDELEAKIIELLGELGQQKMTMVLRLQGEQTDSESYNQTLKEIIADLNSLYFESNILDSLIINHEQLNKSILTNLQKDLSKLENKIDSLNLLADNVQGYGTACKENFSSLGILEDRKSYSSLFIDKNGKPLLTDAEVDTVEGVLKLGASSKYDRIHTLINGKPTTVAEIKILEQVGEGFSDKDPNYSPDKAIDGKPDTFWGEVILSDGVLKVPLMEGSWSGLEGGALCVFKIVFPSPCTVSQFSIKPYSEYPFEIVGIGYTRDDTNQVAGWCGQHSPSQDPVLVDQGISLDFPFVNAKSLIVIVRQNHAYKNIYKVTRDQLYNRELWSKIAAEERTITLDTLWADGDPGTINPTLGQDKIDKFDQTWMAFLSSQEGYNSQAVGAILAGVAAGALAGAVGTGLVVGALLFPKQAPKAPERVQVEKYEYVYGAYEIDVFGNEYNPEGIFVSRPHEISGNVQRVVLEAKEKHPVFTNLSGNIIKKKTLNENLIIVDHEEPLRRTSVEYYVSCGDSPNDPWYPILPLDQTYINNEFLKFVDPERQVAELRFYCSYEGDTQKTPRLYKNETPLEINRDWVIQEKTPGLITSGQRIYNYKLVEIFPHVWDPGAMYTIDYYPDNSYSDPHEIDFLSSAAYDSSGSEASGSTPKQKNEYFNLSPEKLIDKNCSAKLEFYPYTDRSRLFIEEGGETKPNYTYNPVQVVLNPAKYSSELYYLEGKEQAITSEVGPWETVTRDKVYGERDPGVDRENPPLARTLNVTDYSSPDLPVLNAYNPLDKVPTFEYFHTGKRVYFSETFRHDSPTAAENFGITHGNAIVQIRYEYLVSGVRCKIILRRCPFDASITPKVDWYSLKFKVLY